MVTIYGKIKNCCMLEIEIINDLTVVTMSDELMDIKQLAEYLDLSEKTIKGLIKC